MRTVFLVLIGCFLLASATLEARAQNLITTDADCVKGNSIAASWNTTDILCGKPAVSGEPNQDPGTNTVPGDAADDAIAYFYDRNVGTSSMSRTITGLSAGATYRFETYIASLAGGSPDALVVTLQWQDGSGGNVGSIVSLVDASAGDNTWIQVEETGIVAPSGATQVVLEVAFEDRGGNDAFTDIFTDEFTFEETAAPPVNSDPVFANGTSAGLTVDEDAAAASLSTQLEVDDSDTGQTLTWTVASGPSNGALSGFPATASSGTGVQPSGVTYEPNTDYVGGDSFEIQVDDGNGGTDNITVNVAVNNLAPVFSSAATASFQENGTGTVLDNDATNGGDGTTDSGVTYSIGGTDAGAFTIDSATGALSFNAAPDFENPADSDGNNEYLVDVTADDGEASNNTTTQTITITVTNVTADLALFDGSAAGLNVTASINPGTSNNRVGVVELSATQDEAVLEALSITNSNAGIAGISAARLFLSSDPALDVGTFDTELGSISIDNTNAPATFDFTSLNTEITSTAIYLILAIDVEASAPDNDVLFSLADPAAVTIPDANIASVNGQSQTTFSSLPLSNASTALPVELVAFESPDNGNALLQWTTVSEKGNAGFDVQRQLAAASWSTLARVPGVGTTTQQTTYRFTDDTLPYESGRRSIVSVRSMWTAPSRSHRSEPLSLRIQTESNFWAPRPTRPPERSLCVSPFHSVSAAASLRCSICLDGRCEPSPSRTAGPKRRR